MPGIFDKIKSGADKAAFEADRLRRVTQAQGALNKLKGELSTHITAIGTRVVELRDSGSPAQPELEDLFQQLDGLRQQVADQQAEVERIRQEKAPEAPAAAPAPAGQTCPNCHAEVAAGVKFCPELRFQGGSGASPGHLPQLWGGCPGRVALLPRVRQNHSVK
jgi:hypothetical protein